MLFPSLGELFLNAAQPGTSGPRPVSVPALVAQLIHRLCELSDELGVVLPGPKLSRKPVAWIHLAADPTDMDPTAGGQTVSTSNTASLCKMPAAGPTLCHGQCQNQIVNKENVACLQETM